CTGQNPCERCLVRDLVCEYDVDISSAQKSDEGSKQLWLDLNATMIQLKRQLETVDADLQAHKSKFNDCMSHLNTRLVAMSRGARKDSTDSFEDDANSTVTDDLKYKPAPHESTLADEFCLYFTTDGISIKGNVTSLTRFYDILTRLSHFPQLPATPSRKAYGDGAATDSFPKLVRNMDLSHQFGSEGMVDFWKPESSATTTLPPRPPYDKTRLTKELIDDLVNIHFRTCYKRSTIVNRPHLLQLYHEPPKDNLAASMLLCIICAMSTKNHVLLDYKDRAAVSDVFYSRFKDLSGECFDHVSITAIQAYALAAYWTIATQGPLESRAYITQATRMCNQLGLHSAGYYCNNDPRETALHKRLFWFVFAVDFIIAVSSGKPSLWKQEDVTLPPPTADDFDPESDEEVKEYVRQFAMMISLFRLMKSIATVLYSPREEGSDDEVVGGLEETLTIWYEDLPKEAHLDWILEVYRTPGIVPTWSDHYALLLNMVSTFLSSKWMEQRTWARNDPFTRNLIPSLPSTSITEQLGSSCTKCSSRALTRTGRS
ncbi:fungal-specific transcription factor domain-containing protein, partial [Jimgerdemannia flammicorona]